MKPARLHPKDPSGLKRHISAKARGARIRLAPDHPASAGASTIFTKSVFDAADVPRVLINGYNSPKTGSPIKKGVWAGMPIYTLTLIERETCPRSCLEWATCMGNNMNWARRIRPGEELEDALWGELWQLNGDHPDGFVVRLHVLGDFYSVAYVDWWRQALAQFAALRVFGYTARSPFEPIGQAVFLLTSQHWDRFAIRFSGWGFDTMTTEVVDRADEATGLICPAQTSKTACCATCTLCWSTDRKISFLRH